MNRLRNGNWRPLVFTLLAGAAMIISGCSGEAVSKSSSGGRTLRLPAQWRLNPAERKLRKAVEADSFPPANEQGL